MKKIYSLCLLMLLSTYVSLADTKNLVSRTLQVAELPSNNLSLYKNATRTKYVEIDFSILNEKDQFTISLFGQQTISFNFTQKYSYSIGSTSWVGQNHDGSEHVIFSFFKGNINGMMYDMYNKKYMVQQINNTNLFAISEVNIESMQESPVGQNDYIEDHTPQKKSRANADVCDVATTCGGPNTIDLMVLGAAAAITEAGGTVAAFTTNVTSAVTEMNTSYSNSGGTNLTFNLIHCDATGFVTTSDMNADLTNFRSDLGVQTLRNIHYADLVSLWSGSGNYAGFCGLGYLNNTSTNYNDNAAYTVCDYGCGMTNLSYAHECGHNMGLQHDYFVASSTLPCAHHHGYTNQAVIPSGLPTSARWRTIMAYNNECSSNGFNCTRLPRWSNPTLNYLGSPTGIAIGLPEPAYEIFGFERFRCVVAGFRSNPLPVNLISFTGETHNKNIELQWITAGEENNKGFEIEMKRNDKDEFATIGYVASKTSTKLNANYSYNVNNLIAGTYYFRLKQLDIDNKTSLSETIKLSVDSKDIQLDVHPNPAKEKFTLSLYNPKNQPLSICIYDLFGKKIKDVYEGNSTEGFVEFTVATEGMRKGIYYCTVVNETEKYVSKIVIE